jgi:hypothetical protein
MTVGTVKSLADTGALRLIAMEVANSLAAISARSATRIVGRTITVNWCGLVAKAADEITHSQWRK